MQSKVEEMTLSRLVTCSCIFYEEGKEMRITILLCLFIVTFLRNMKISLNLSCLSLPWQGLKAGTKKQKYDKISERKMLTPVEVPHLSIILLTFSFV